MLVTGCEGDNGLVDPKQYKPIGDILDIYLAIDTVRRLYDTTQLDLQLSVEPISSNGMSSLAIVADLLQDMDFMHAWDHTSSLGDETHFAAVRDLRLLSWMHRDLVNAIVTSIDVRRLCRLRLDYLYKESALSIGDPMPAHIAEEFAHSVDRRRDGGLSGTMIDGELIVRQNSGTACIFPRPTWWPLRLLSASNLECLEEM
ncbi:hypothetical protein DOTSEDRAFT_72981 [Dothistroma septosporum NZE10]|uniref:Uncharacterized protein n=1 Tax=Dothistroma septosporum (strain NZE10 / CBS 128990) TaxID=675120 RepID=N1PL78_DOTSN|nr:hypothetical protein DOTSEDRAFT_72981 [Dothistroma septosporum NZE10]